MPAPRARVRISGLAPMVRALEKAGVEVTDLKEVFAGIAAEVVRLAGEYAPERSGALKRSIRGSRAKNKAVVSVGSAKVPYAAVINYGPRSTRRLFMQKADQMIRPTLERRVEDGLRDVIRKYELH